MNFCTVLFRSLALLGLFLLGSCGGDRGQTEFDSRNIQDQEIQAAVIEINGLQAAIEDKEFLASNTSQERKAIQKTLFRIKISLIKLDRGVDAQESIKLLYRSVTQFSKYPFLRQDENRVKSIEKKANIILYKYAKAHKVNVKTIKFELFKHSFNKPKLHPFQSARLSHTAPEWEAFQLSGRYRFAKIANFKDGEKAVGESWLLSPKISLVNAEDLKMKIDLTVKNPIWDKLKVKISTDYNGDDPSATAWDEIDYIEDPSVASPGRWTDLTSKAIDLTPYKGKEIVLAFQFISEESDDQVWEIANINIWGIGDTLKYKTYRMNFQTPEPPPVQQEEPQTPPVQQEVPDTTTTGGTN
ncbi:MAG: choice-of-anchor J domain-containing protein [Bacteriovoracaceae bacterium]